jgi:iron complex outermembrane receptor protein
VQVSANGTSQFISNAGSARIYGLDTDLTARLTDEFTLTAALSLLNAHYVNYSAAFVLVPRYGLATDPVPGAPAGNRLGNVDASGKRMPRAPTATSTLTGDYTKRFDSGTLDLNALAYYSTKTYFDSIQRVSQGGYTILNARVSWQPAHSRFRFELWGKNLANRDYIVSVFEDNISDAAGYAPPRTFGGTVKYSF